MKSANFIRPSKKHPIFLHNDDVRSSPVYVTMIDKYHIEVTIIQKLNDETYKRFMMMTTHIFAMINLGTTNSFRLLCIRAKGNILFAGNVL